MTPGEKHQDFESAIERLSEITDLLETGETSLEESVNLYTEGLKIAQFCEKKLAEAQKKIKIIREKSGLLSEEDFDQNEVDT